MTCKVCSSSDIIGLFVKKVLNKYEVQYYQCQNCQFIFIDNPYWLKEAYSSVITSLDIGLLSRNLNFKPITKSLIKLFYNKNGEFLDYAGGYGVFTRIMRDAGFNFIREDFQCENIFAKDFDITNFKNKGFFELLTAFEVFEHLQNPIEEIGKMLKFSNSILFSTELQPENQQVLSNWWYWVPETGQHISFYSLKSLKIIARKFNLNLITNNRNIHLLTNKKKIGNFSFKMITKYRIALVIDKVLKNNSSLLPVDFKFIKDKINK